MALPQRVQSLPQELYDKIYLHTFGIRNPDINKTSTSTHTASSTPKPSTSAVPPTSQPQINSTSTLSSTSTSSPSTSALPPTPAPKPTTTLYIVIDEDYTPPMQLQIYHRLRQDFRNANYANTTFIGYAPDMVSWFRSLSPQDRALVKSIHCWLVPEGGRARQSRGFLSGCELKDLGAQEVDYCLYKDCIEKKLCDAAGKLRICHI